MFAHKSSDKYIAQTQEIIPFVQGELQYFRDRMRPVIFCNTVNSGPIIRELSPRSGELCIEKKLNNAFSGTRLGEFLRDKKIQTLTLVGLQLCNNILLTAGSALEQNFSIVVPETCVCSDCDLDHLAALRIVTRWSKQINAKYE